ncbi:hypothetical protein [Moheibacter sediminis]|uniref:Uncharacterized protein n=1 Tax=Moheibacter sediminis TaxID=1434700 RepID=A0A1W1ZLM6_9FLAO|nr:hypothetical protein [Moheibacter sediminis]SMC49277.1 hypothetical protein SAMN06296427_10361 [Moheibacter sediminis]
MKKVILGMLLFGGAFTLTNEMVKANTSVAKESSKVENFTMNCSPDGTCVVTYYCNGFGNPPTGTQTYYNLSAAACRQMAQNFAAEGCN